MQRLSLGQIAIAVALVALLIVACGWGAWVWSASGDVQMGTAGWLALIMGSLFSLVIGCGLMALMFFSNRSGHDEVADPFRKPPDAPPEE
jgi:hypothetical protein